MKSLKLAMIAAAIALSAGAGWAADKIDPRARAAVAKQDMARVIIVTRANSAFKDGGNAFARPATYMSSRLGANAKIIKRIGELPAVAAMVNASALEALREDPNVVAVVPDVARPPALFDTVKSTGAAIHHEAGFTGKGWNVAILDSGVDRDHLMFQGAMWAEACFGTNGEDATAKAQSFCKDGATKAFGKNTGRNCPMEFSELCFHGTHVAGIAAGRPVQLEDGRVLQGIAPESKIVAVQVFSGVTGKEACGGEMERCILAFDSDTIGALDWLYRKRDKLKLASVNMSLGAGDFKEHCDADNPAYTEAVQRLRDAGIAVVIASGNEAIKDGIGYPACFSSAVSVSATRKDGPLDESYSNIAPFVTLAAPGSEIASAAPGNQIVVAGGTSMAAPHVAGAFALLRQEYPDKSVNELVKILRKKGRVVKAEATGTKLRRIDLSRIEPGSADPAALPAGAAASPDDSEDAPAVPVVAPETGKPARITGAPLKIKAAN